MNRSADAMETLLTADNNKLFDRIAAETDPIKKTGLIVKAAEDAKTSSAQVPDTHVYRVIVWALGLVALLALIGAFVLALRTTAIPEVIVALGSAAIGALAGVLVPQVIQQKLT